jgi:transcription elongation factor Elf1
MGIMKTSLDHLKPLMRCPVCNKKYAPAKALLLEEQENHSVLHMTCPACGVSTVVFVSASQWGVVSMGVLTDLEGTEARNLFRNEAISTDQVIEMHNFLKEFKGSAKDFV